MVEKRYSLRGRASTCRTRSIRLTGAVVEMSSCLAVRAPLISRTGDVEQARVGLAVPIG